MRAQPGRQHGNYSRDLLPAFNIQSNIPVSTPLHCWQSFLRRPEGEGLSLGLRRAQHDAMESSAPCQALAAGGGTLGVTPTPRADRESAAPVSDHGVARGPCCSIRGWNGCQENTFAPHQRESPRALGALTLPPPHTLCRRDGERGNTTLHPRY